MGSRLRPESFRHGTKLAVVGVYTSPDVKYWTKSVGVGPFGATQINDHTDEMAKATEVLNDTKRAAFRGLASARSFRLVPEESVLSSAGYAAARTSKPGTFTSILVPAHGYRRFFEEPEIAGAARALKVDGGLIVSMEHYCVPDGGDVVGLVTISFAAVDTAGRYMWWDYTLARSDRKLPADAALNADSVRPLLVDSTEKGARALVKLLDARLGG